jgi:hypothetical protein
MRSKGEMFKIKCEISSIKNNIILGKEINTVEVSCSSKEKIFGKAKYTMAVGFGMRGVLVKMRRGLSR